MFSLSKSKSKSRDKGILQNMALRIPDSQSLVLNKIYKNNLFKNVGKTHPEIQGFAKLLYRNLRNYKKLA
jgi:hypothetical protein